MITWIWVEGFEEYVFKESFLYWLICKLKYWNNFGTIVTWHFPDKILLAPDWPDALYSGYTATMPGRAIRFEDIVYGVTHVCQLLLDGSVLFLHGIKVYHISSKLQLPSEFSQNFIKLLAIRFTVIHLIYEVKYFLFHLCAKIWLL